METIGSLGATIHSSYEDRNIGKCFASHNIEGYKGEMNRVIYYPDRRSAYYCFTQIP